MTRIQSVPLRVFLVLEAVCLGSFLAGLGFGLGWMASVFLVLPVLMVGFLPLVDSHRRILLSFAALFPLTLVEFLPHLFREVVVFAGMLGLVFVTQVFDPLVRDVRERNPVPSHVKLLLGVMVMAIALSCGHAYLGGWLSIKILRYSFGLLTVLLAVWVFASVSKDEDELRRVLLVLVVSTAVACLPLPFFATAARKVFLTPFGDMNLNLVGMFGAALALVGLGQMMTASGKERVVLMLAVAVLVFVVIFTRARGAWVGFGLGYLYLAVRTRSAKLVLVLVGVLAVLFISEGLRVAVEERVQQTGIADYSLMGRLLLWSTGLHAFRENWLFGIGVEGFRFLKYDYGFPRPLDPRNWHGTHNMFLEQFVSLGLFGGVAFAVLPFVTALRLDRFARRLATGQSRTLAVGLNAGLIAYAGHAMVDSPGWHIPSFVVWGLLVGCAIRQAALVSGSLRQSPRVTLGVGDDTSPGLSGGVTLST